MFYASSHNPRSEGPAAIVEAMVHGVPSPEQGGAQLVKIIDRAQAIARAIANTDAHDTILIAGKGQDDYQIIGSEKIEFDDRVHAHAARGRWPQARS